MLDTSKFDNQDMVVKFAFFIGERMKENYQVKRSMEELEAYIECLELADDIKEILIEKTQVLKDEVKQTNLELQILREQWKDNTQKACFYEAAIDALPNPVFIKNERGEFVYFNEAYQKYFDMSRELYIGKTVLDLKFLPMDERERYQAEDLKLIETRRIKHYESDFELSSGAVGHSLYWSRGFMVEEEGEKGLIGEIVDISKQKCLQREIIAGAKQLKEANKKIEKMMNLDILTGLYNRRAIKENKARIDWNINNEGSHISLIMADLDDFKKVNDTFGHVAGDEVLIAFSLILVDCNCKDDLIIRFGGEEFLIVLFDTEVRDAKVIAERIRCTAEKNLLLPDGRHNTVSLGVAEIMLNENFDNAVHRADSALYVAKKTGKNKVVSK